MFKTFMPFAMHAPRRRRVPEDPLRSPRAPAREPGPRSGASMALAFALLDAAQELVRIHRLRGASVQYSRGPRGEHVVAIVFGRLGRDQAS
ncbi:MAG TPA: hypothetical protein VKU41_01635 [Polyangiaceae bacterium]|nr:hypothetical protein [Polyangiaceae bacterium]